MDRMTRKEAADYLRISTDTLDNRRAEGKISAVQDGGRIFYEQSELDRYHESLKVKPALPFHGGTLRKRRVKTA